MKATLILANGSIFSGSSIGSAETRVCEMVFNTSMAGYQEILTDPSYAGQGVVMSYPLIGNYGVNSEDNESRRPWVEAFVVRHLSPRGSNFRCEGDLGSYLKEHNITGIQGVDTRALTKILRSQGSMNGMLTCAEHFNIAQVLEQLKAYKVEGAVRATSTKEAYTVQPEGEAKKRIALIDYGTKRNILRELVQRGAEVTVLPCTAAAKDIAALGADGIMLSNGPGDPAENGDLIENLKEICKLNIPMFGICLGHQLLALAHGAQRTKLKYGHRGENQPVKNLETGRVYVTSQNHGYAIVGDSLDEKVGRQLYRNVNDGTCEGMRYLEHPAFSVQFHPEACGGPLDTEELFDEFFSMLAT